MFCLYFIVHHNRYIKLELSGREKLCYIFFKNKTDNKTNISHHQLYRKMTGTSSGTLGS